VKHSVADSLFRRSQSGDTMWKAVIPPAASALRGEIYSPRQFTPDERSPRPFTPDVYSPRPFTPDERSPRPLFRGDVSTAAVKHSVADSLFRRSQSGDTMWKAVIPPAAFSDAVSPADDFVSPNDSDEIPPEKEHRGGTVCSISSIDWNLVAGSVKRQLDNFPAPSPCSEAVTGDKRLFKKRYSAEQEKPRAVDLLADLRNARRRASVLRKALRKTSTVLKSMLPSLSLTTSEMSLQLPHVEQVYQPMTDDVFVRRDVDSSAKLETGHRFANPPQLPVHPAQLKELAAPPVRSVSTSVTDARLSACTTDSAWSELGLWNSRESDPSEEKRPSGEMDFRRDTTDSDIAALCEPDSPVISFRDRMSKTVELDKIKILIERAKSHASEVNGAVQRLSDLSQK